MCVCVCVCQNLKRNLCAWCRLQQNTDIRSFRRKKDMKYFKDYKIIEVYFSTK